MFFIKEMISVENQHFNSLIFYFCFEETTVKNVMPNAKFIKGWVRVFLEVKIET